MFLGGCGTDGNVSSGMSLLASIHQQCNGRMRSTVIEAHGIVVIYAAVFDMEYSRWLDEGCKNTMELRQGLEVHLPDADLRAIVDKCLTHYDQLFQLKATAAKLDVFHIITGMWATPAERCFLWMGGFKPSELLRVPSYISVTIIAKSLSY